MAPMGRIAIVLALLMTGSSVLAAQAPTRVETAVALAQIIKKVDPVVPASAIAAKVGGVVIADVTIGPAGRVSSVTILGGPEMLGPAAERALRQWTFEPFLLGGKPRPVQVILEVRFPDPVKEAEDRIFEAHRTSAFECGRQLQIDAAKAEDVCADAVEKANALPVDRVLERSHAVADYAHSLMAMGRSAEAITHFRRVIEIRATRVKGPDADTAEVHQVIALLHQQLGAHADADAEFQVAVDMYTAALDQLPSMAWSYAPRLKNALLRYAALKRLMGDSRRAEALDARARSTDKVAPPAVPATPPMTRRVGDLELVERHDARLTDADINQIRQALRPTGRNAWRLRVWPSSEFSKGPQSLSVDAFLAPDLDTSTVRRGRLVMLTTAIPPGTKDSARTWRPLGGQFRYIQVGSSEGEAAATPPIRVQAAPNSPPLGDDVLVRIVTMMRSRAVPQRTDRLMSDVQPWPITSIMAWSNGEVHVDLEDPAAARRRQSITLRQNGGDFTIVEMR